MDAMGALGQDNGQQDFIAALANALSQLQGSQPPPVDTGAFVQQALAAPPPPTANMGAFGPQPDMTAQDQQSFIRTLANYPEIMGLMGGGMPGPDMSRVQNGFPQGAPLSAGFGKPMSEGERMGSPASIPFTPSPQTSTQTAQAIQPPSGLGLGYNQPVDQQGNPVYGPGGPGGAVRNLGSAAAAAARGGMPEPYAGGRIPQGWVRAADGGQAAWLMNANGLGDTAYQLQTRNDLEAERLAEKAARDAKAAAEAAKAAPTGGAGGGAARTGARTGNAEVKPPPGGGDTLPAATIAARNDARNLVSEAAGFYSSIGDAGSAQKATQVLAQLYDPNLWKDQAQADAVLAQAKSVRDYRRGFDTNRVEDLMAGGRAPLAGPTGGEFPPPDLGAPPPSEAPPVGDIYGGREVAGGATNRVTPPSPGGGGEPARGNQPVKPVPVSAQNPYYNPPPLFKAPPEGVPASAASNLSNIDVGGFLDPAVQAWIDLPYVVNGIPESDPRRSANKGR